MYTFVDSYSPRGDSVIEMVPDQRTDERISLKVATYVQWNASCYHSCNSPNRALDDLV